MRTWGITLPSLRSTLTTLAEIVETRGRSQEAIKIRARIAELKKAAQKAD